MLEQVSYLNTLTETKELYDHMAHCICALKIK